MANTVGLLLIYGVIVSFICHSASSSPSIDSESLINSPKTSDLYKCRQDKQWFWFNSSTKAYSCKQLEAVVSGRITCSDDGPIMEIGVCATYDENTQAVSFSTCSNQAEVNDYNRSAIPWSIQLPTILTELNDYMCGPLNRKGLVCSECADGFGPSVASFEYKYKCVNCTNTSYGVPLFLVIKLFPITVLYLISLAFQIRITSAPLPCFIMYAQVVTFVFDFRNYLVESVMLKQNGDVSLFVKVIDTLYGVFHLEFFNFILPPFCISSRLQLIHIAFFGYFSIFYPILLMFMTWLCVELHGHNFRPLVWLWRPFHRCFVRLRRGWDTKSDIIDVFITFFILSYSTVVHQSLLMISGNVLVSIDASGMRSSLPVPSVDNSLTYKDAHYYLFAVPSFIIALFFNVLLPLLLILYPIKAFQSCLSKSHLNIITLNIFIEKIQNCYRNGLDGGRDMRSFSGLYFLLLLFAYIVEAIAKADYSYFPHYFLSGVLFSVIALTIALVKPYKKTYMTYLDTLILFDLAVLCFVVSLKEQQVLVVKILTLIPMIVFIVVLLLRKVVSEMCIRIQRKKQNPALPVNEPTNTSTIIGNPSPMQPLIQPTSTALSYNTMQQ